MYAVINLETGVIRKLSYSRQRCLEEQRFLASIDETCVIVEVPQMMFDHFGAQLLALHNGEEVSDK